MSDQTTGATPEQIEAAAKLKYESLFSGGGHWERCAEWIRAGERRSVGKIARFLVPPGYVIVPEATVPNPEEPAAVGEEDDDEWKPRDRTSALMLEASEIGSVDLKFDRGSAPFTVYIHANRYETFQGHGYSLEEATEAALADARTPR